MNSREPLRAQTGIAPAWMRRTVWVFAIALWVSLFLLAGCAAALSEVGRSSQALPLEDLPTPATDVEFPGAGTTGSTAVSRIDTVSASASLSTESAINGSGVVPAVGLMDVNSLPDIATVAERVSSAVVSIKATSQQRTFFGVLPREGEGSGFIIDGTGHVVTNSHVIASATSVTVTLPDGRVFPDSIVVGTDPTSDLAVIRVVGINLPTVEIGRSGELRVGSWVVAVGNAVGLGTEPTVTAGIVSAVGREVQTTEGCPPLANLIQTDAAINPGNSGGPLFNLDGQVVGINTAVQRTTSGGIVVEGVGFAIAVDGALPIIDQLIEKGFVEKPWIGVGIYTVTPGIAAQFRLRAETGVFVNNVYPRSAAERAGLRFGQVITRIDDHTIRTVQELLNIVGSHIVGDQIVVAGVDPSGDEFTRRLTLGQKERTCSAV